MGDLRPFPPARLLPVLGMGDLYLYAFSPGSAGYGRSAPAVPLWLGSISMSICGGDPMAAHSARPGSGLVWAICARFPRPLCPPGRSAPHGVPMFSVPPRFPCFLHFTCEFPLLPISAHFREFLPVPGGGWQQHCLGVKSLQFFSLPAAAGRGAAPRRVESYRLYAMGYAQ